MKSIVSRTLAILVLLSLANAIAAEDQRAAPQAEMVSFKLRIVEALPGTSPKTLAEPTMMTVTGREIRLASGGEMKSKFDDSKHDLGTQITATIEPHENETYKLKLNVTLGNLKLPEGEPETELFLEQKLTARTIVEAGKTKKVAISPGRWCEITIEKPTANPQSAPSTISSTSSTKTTATPTTTMIPVSQAPAPVERKIDPDFSIENLSKVFSKFPSNFVER